jgi:hypothetical protein
VWESAVINFIVVAIQLVCYDQHLHITSLDGHACVLLLVLSCLMCNCCLFGLVYCLVILCVLLFCLCIAVFLCTLDAGLLARSQ